MTLQKQQALARGNISLAQRCSQLQDDVLGRSAELQRAREQLEHASARRQRAGAPSPLSPLAGGQ